MYSEPIQLSGEPRWHDDHGDPIKDSGTVTCSATERGWRPTYSFMAVAYKNGPRKNLRYGEPLAMRGDGVVRRGMTEAGA